MKSFLLKILSWKLKILTRIYIWRFRPTIIGITGSAGKTSAKKAIYAALGQRFRVRHSQGNFNTELGLSLTFLGEWKEITKPLWWFWLKVLLKGAWGLLMPKRWYPEILILEYGADKPGDISTLLSIATPHIAVLTAIGNVPVHVEHYPVGVEQVAKEKTKLISNLGVHDIAVCNEDDALVRTGKEKTRAQKLSFGFSKSADIRISNFSHIIKEERIKGIHFKLERDGAMVPVVLEHVFSVGHAYAAACAVMVARALNIHMIEAANSLSQYYRPEAGRSGIIPGVKNTQIIDESYNSSPLALELALKTLESITYTRRVGVLGDMLELGEHTIKAHEAIGMVAPNALDVLVTVGTRAALIAKKAVKKGMGQEYVFSFDTAEEAAKPVEKLLKKGDVILVKGSRSIGLETVIEEIRG